MVLIISRIFFYWADFATQCLTYLVIFLDKWQNYSWIRDVQMSRDLQYVNNWRGIVSGFSVVIPSQCEHKVGGG